MTDFSNMFKECPLVDNFCTFFRQRPLVTSFGYLALDWALEANLDNMLWESLVADFSNLFWELPLVDNFGNLIQECPWWQIWTLCLGSIPGDRLTNLLLWSIPWWPLWQLGSGAPLHWLPILENCQRRALGLHVWVGLPPAG